MTQITEENIIAYFLGELSEPEAERVEEAVFNGDAVELDLEGIEHDLIDAYLYGELTAERRKRFEENYLGTEARRRRVAEAAALQKTIDPQSAPAPEPVPEPVPVPVPVKKWFSRLLAAFRVRPLALRLAVPALVLIVAVGGVWLVGFRERAPRTFAEITPAFSLSSVRNGEGSVPPPIVHLPFNSDALRLFLKKPESQGESAKYQARMLEKSGREVKLTVEPAKGDVLPVIVLRSQLLPGKYQVMLSKSVDNGPFVELSGHYSFKVE